MILTIFAALVSESEPPNTVKSCAKANTGRPSTKPCPATTPSPGTIWLSMPKSRHRWVTSLSTSSKVPGSNSRSIRSRAVSLPAACWRSSRSSPPPSSARRSRSARTSSGFMVGGRRARSGFDGLGFLPVLEKLLQPDGRERVVEQLLDQRRRTCRDVRAHPRGLDHMDRMAAAGDEHLGRELVVVVDVHDLADQLHPVGAHV